MYRLTARIVTRKTHEIIPRTRHTLNHYFCRVTQDEVRGSQQRVCAVRGRAQSPAFARPWLLLFRIGIVIRLPQLRTLLRPAHAASCSGLPPSLSTDPPLLPVHQHLGRSLVSRRLHEPCHAHAHSGEHYHHHHRPQRSIPLAALLHSHLLCTGSPILYPQPMPCSTRTLRTPLKYTARPAVTFTNTSPRRIYLMYTSCRALG